jgi:L-threonylcarbamoyladenylate synthase
VPYVLAVDAVVPDPRVIEAAVRVLRSGGLVAVPTETVYGLAARLFDPAALARVFAAKSRPAAHPLIAHVEGAEQGRSLAAPWPKRADRLASAFWPGPLTMVVGRASHVPPEASGGGDSIAVRAPSHAVARAVIVALGEPIAAPSANRYQGVSPTTAPHVVNELGNAVDLVLDAGPCAVGIESTVVDVRGPRARVLRPGAVDLASLRLVEPDVEAAARTAEAGESRASPGMDARHYAPRAKLLIADTWEEARRTAHQLAAQGARVGLVTYEAAPGHPHESSVREAQVLVHALSRDPVEYARDLYATLHDLDDADVEVIVVQGVPREEAWWAVADRLRRGARP